MAKASIRKKEEARKKQEQAKDKKARDSWQEIVDEAHAEAILENNIRTADDIIYQAYSSNEQVLDNLSYSVDDSIIKEARYSDELKLRAQDEQRYANAMDIDVRDMDSVHQEALKMNKQYDANDALKQKDIKINGMVDDVFEISQSSGTAHRALNNLNRQGLFDNQDDFNIAKARLTAKYNNQTTRSIINRPDMAEGINRMKGKTPDFRYEFKNAYAISSQADGKIVGNVAKEFAENTVQEGAEDVGNQYLKRALSGRNIGALVNAGFALSDFNEARNSGDGVAKSVVKAGAQFVAGEMLGGWMMPVMLAKQLPSLAVSAVETTQNVTRKMNSTARIQTFGEAQFQDTQQLATMRQAGMEMARMSQYNLQQSIMGNEAQYMHRL